ncbi:hypothetical protein [Streptomyces sp. NBC_00859]|uniref:hypothetical protein n=1 Tax=Streptomyces sp. NBC_00859 TaxID=2903682 RepID=UPI003870A681|nr:hypothetical protein OG584_03135 [Streptomyces sp. NBC_00859]
MRGKGVQYDTGTFPSGDTTRSTCDSGTVARDMQVIAGDLGCNTVRITGGDPERLSVAAAHAAAAGLEAWFSPFPCEMTNEEMLPYFADCADRAEALRRAGAEVVLVTGCEISLFGVGYLPGDTFNDRMHTLRAAPEERAAALQEIPGRVNAFLAEVVETVRPRFGGRLSYASIPIEHIDWTPFDIVGVDAYRNSRNAADYREQVRRYFAHGKPVAVTEAGCCAYRGAADLGAGGWTVIGADGLVAEGTVRDEGEQVRYMRELLPLFEDEGIDTTFWFSFAGFELPHRADPRTDLDLGSYGIVKMLEGGARDARPDRVYPGAPWEPKEAFYALAEFYSGTAARRESAGAPVAPVQRG